MLRFYFIQYLGDVNQSMIYKAKMKKVLLDLTGKREYNREQ